MAFFRLFLFIYFFTELISCDIWQHAQQNLSVHVYICLRFTFLYSILAIGYAFNRVLDLTLQNS